MALSDVDIEYVKGLDPDKVYVIGINTIHLTQHEYEDYAIDYVKVFNDFDIKVVVVSSTQVNFIEPKGE